MNSLVSSQIVASHTRVVPEAGVGDVGEDERVGVQGLLDVDVVGHGELSVREEPVNTGSGFTRHLIMNMEMSLTVLIVFMYLISAYLAVDGDLVTRTRGNTLLINTDDWSI